MLEQGYLEAGYFHNAGMLLNHQVSRVPAVVQHHVGLPVLAARDALLDTPPELNFKRGTKLGKRLQWVYQKSSSVSPRQANTGMPASARAAATSFWVE